MVVFAHVCTCVLIEFDLHHVSVSVFASVNVFRYESDRHTTTSFSNFRRYFFDVGVLSMSPQTKFSHFVDDVIRQCYRDQEICAKSITLRLVRFFSVRL